MSNQLVPNGCGPWFLGTLVPNGPQGRFRSACNIHDNAYNTGGGAVEKRSADEELLALCLASVQYAGPGTRYLGTAWAYFYFACVRALGWLTWRG